MFGNKGTVIRNIKNAFNNSLNNLKEIQNQCGLNGEYSNLRSAALRIYTRDNAKTTNSDTNENLSYFGCKVLSEIDSTMTMTEFTKSLTKYVYKNKKKTKSKLSLISAISRAKKEIINWGKQYDKTSKRVKKNFNEVKRFVEFISAIKKAEDFDLNEIKDKINNFKNRGVIDFCSENMVVCGLGGDVNSMDEEKFKDFLEHIEGEMESSVEKYFPGLK